MNDFDIIRLDKIKFNFNELLEYYNILEKNFSHLKWKTDFIKDQNQLEGVKYYTDGTFDLPWYSWGIQISSNSQGQIEGGWRAGTDPSKIPEETYTTSGPLVFGIAKKMIDKIPSISQLGLVVHPPGGKIIEHQDIAPEDINLYTVHIPIVTNDKAFWINSSGRHVLEPGFAYLLNTHRVHGTDNQGSTPRIHLLFRTTIESAETLVNEGIDIS